MRLSLIIVGLISCQFASGQDTGDSATGEARQGQMIDQTISEMEMRGMKPLIEQLSIFLLRVMNGAADQAGESLEMSRELTREIELSDAIRNHIPEGKEPPVNRLEVVGYEFYSTRLVSMIFVRATAKGPLCVRLNVVKPDDDTMFLHSFEATEDWAAMDKMVKSVERLGASLKVEYDVDRIKRLINRTAKPETKSE